MMTLSFLYIPSLIVISIHGISPLYALRVLGYRLLSLGLSFGKPLGLMLFSSFFLASILEVICANGLTTLWDLRGTRVFTFL